MKLLNPRYHVVSHHTQLHIGSKYWILREMRVKDLPKDVTSAFLAFDETHEPAREEKGNQMIEMNE